MQWNQLFAARTNLMRRSAVRELLRLTAQPEMISFAGGLPAAEFFPVEELRRAADKVLSECGPQALQYGETGGIAPLRDWIAGRFDASAGVGRDNVLIVSGAQQALDLIGRVFLDPGDRVMVENPTYLALLSAWRPLGAEFIPVDSDADGLDVEALETLMKPRPKLIYCVPNFQNPQGTTLSESRRHRLVEIARRNGTGLIEDDPYGRLRYLKAPFPSLLEVAASIKAGNAGPSPVVQVGTFSKVLAPGLRIGWIVAHEAVINCLVRAKQAMDLHTSTFTQWLVHEVVRTGFLERHMPRLRQAYGERRDAMLDALQKFMPAEVSWTLPDGGMFLLARLPASMDARRLLEICLTRNVAFVPGEEFHLDGRGVNALRLNFTNASPDRIDEGIRRLAGAVKEELSQARKTAAVPPAGTF